MCIVQSTMGGCEVANYAQNMDLGDDGCCTWLTGCIKDDDDSGCHKLDAPIAQDDSIKVKRSMET